jgi:hypothetical protein
LAQHAMAAVPDGITDGRNYYNGGLAGIYPWFKCSTLQALAGFSSAREVKL